MALEGHPRSIISCHFKPNVKLPMTDQQQPRPYLAPFSHNTSATDDDGRQPCQKRLTA